ncbi:oxygenase [Streptomyces sp. 8K308]|uniref:FAD-dependent monooxygenase n=1 Tax=Streptomyces sp. 8K308 TaxID=2530388 RepID=UPI00104BE1F9|nr:FAD-dependent monooxygenase [Streptomyces sp. 8K308]TDC23175.1 oxygenase [Streptomyces sp. 8K308]
MTEDRTVLIAGAGPTGLTAACTLLRQGVDVTVVDRRSGPATAPKAIVTWSGALEVLDRVGVAERVAERALPLSGASYWSRGRKVAAVTFGGLPNTRFPGPLSVPQPVIEELLYERLTQLGGTVRWQTTVRSVTSVGGDGQEGAEVTLDEHEGGETTVRARWLIAADGMHSTVRGELGVPFEGDTYPRDFLLGDVVLDAAGGAPLPEAEAQYHLTPDGVLVVVALPKGGHRVFFDQPAGTRTDRPTTEELQRLLDERGPGRWKIGESWWTSRFQVHARVAGAFRHGAVFLAGDAAHVHSPAGGQGLNTGVQDGYDIGWKLAAVCRGADESLLDSFEAERRPTAVRAVRNADRQTRLWMVRNPVVRALRDTLLRRLSRSGALERRLIPEIAQIDLDLKESPAVARDPAGDGITPGRRIPDTVLTPVHGARAATLHGYLANGRHAVVVFDDGTAGGRAAEAAEQARTRFDREAVDVLLVTSGGVPGAAGYDVATASERRTAQAVYVRPDGYVGARLPLDGARSLGELLVRVPESADTPAGDAKGRR